MAIAILRCSTTPKIIALIFEQSSVTLAKTVNWTSPLILKSDTPGTDCNVRSLLHKAPSDLACQRTPERKFLRVLLDMGKR